MRRKIIHTYSYEYDYCLIYNCVLLKDLPNMDKGSIFNFHEYYKDGKLKKSMIVLPGCDVPCENEILLKACNNPEWVNKELDKKNLITVCPKCKNPLSGIPFVRNDEHSTSDDCYYYYNMSAWIRCLCGYEYKLMTFHTHYYQGGNY